MKKTIKSLAGRALLKSGLYPRLFGDRAVIIAWHRIDDRYPDNPISYSVDGFRRFSEFFKKHFDVVSLRDLLEDLEAGRPIRGKLAITFDDGYRDNYTTAAPILVELGLPATFFIATGFIGTERVPWWDEEAGIQSEWMSWEQVRELAEMGFSIGAHTVNHVDLGSVDQEEARREIETSRANLAERIGLVTDLFAYPYGGAEHISEENRTLVAELSLRCAPSCWGGLVSPSDDPFRLKRQPVSPWFESPGQFAFELLRHTPVRYQPP